jgi:uncharacterized protein (TIGR00255 family)
MVRSMTGFGRGEASNETCRIQVDLRTVNHRYLDLQLRQPRVLQPLEADLRDWVKTRFWRGRLEISVLFQRTARPDEQIHVDTALAQAWSRRLTQLAETLRLKENPSLALIVDRPGVLDFGEDSDDIEAIRPVLREAWDQAAAAAIRMKETEGRALYEDLSAGLARLRAMRDQLVALAPTIQQELLTRYRERALQLAADGTLDESRLHQEIALWLGRLDVNEELVRLASHAEQFRDLLDDGESVGRRLDFLTQEMHREVTTLGNKLQGVQFSRVIVDGKVEIEKIREQVQNVE